MLLSELVTEVEGQTDVLLLGMTDGDSYSRLSVFNPIHCRNKALSGLFNAYHDNPLVRKGGIFIVANPFEPKFSLLNHPSYYALYHEVLANTRDPVEIWDTYSEEYAHRPEFVHKYRTGFAFHGAHPCILMARGCTRSISSAGICCRRAEGERRGSTADGIRAVSHHRSSTTRSRSALREVLLYNLSSASRGTDLLHPRSH